MAEARPIGYRCTRLDTISSVMTKPLSCTGVSASARFDHVGCRSKARCARNWLFKAKKVSQKAERTTAEKSSAFFCIQEIEGLKRNNAPIFGVFAAGQKGITSENVKKFEQTMKQLGMQVEIKSYPDGATSLKIRSTKTVTGGRCCRCLEADARISRQHIERINFRGIRVPRSRIRISLGSLS